MKQEIGRQIPNSTDNQHESIVKTYQSYNTEAHKALILSIIIALTILVLWSIYALIDGNTDVINFSRIPLIMILSTVFYFIKIILLRIKHKLQICNGRYNSSFTNNHSYYSNNDQFYNNNPTYPGTTAYHARDLRK